MSLNWPVILELAAPIAGTLSAWLLARAFGPPPRNFGDFTMEIKVGPGLDVVTLNRPDLFKWGLRLLALSFILQILKAAIW